MLPLYRADRNPVWMEPAIDQSALPQPTVHAFTASDGTELRLTNYPFGKKGPLVLAPGYGNSARAWALDTVPKSFTEYLGEHGYDVWLFDYRASPDLDSSETQFTVDEIAMRDWPAAIEHIRSETGADSVQALGHCIGGLTLCMALGGGLEGVRSATFSALAGHPVPTPANRLRAYVRVPTILRTFGQPTISTDYAPESRQDRLIERVMRTLPIKRVHDSPVGRRIYFIYGDVFDHAQIDEDDDVRRGARVLRPEQHDVLRAHGRDGPARPRRRHAGSRRVPPTPAASASRSRSSPVSTTACSCRAGLPPRTSTCAPRTATTCTRIT